MANGWENASLIETRILYEVNGQKCMNVLHYTNNGLGEPDTMQLLMEAFVDQLWGAANGVLLPVWRAWAAVNVNFTYAQVQKVFPQRVRAFTIQLNQPGQNVGNCEHQNIQGSITKLAHEATRHGQGGIRIGGLPSAAVQAGRLTPDAVNKLSAISVECSSDRQDGISPVIYHPVIATKVKVAGTDPPKYKFDGWLGAKVWFAHDEARTMARRTIGKGD